MTQMARLFEKPDREIDDYEQPFKAHMLRKGWLYEKVISASRRGWPDRFCAKAGRVVLLEWKRYPEEPSPQQKARHTELREQYGIEVVWFNNLEAAKAFFQ